MLRRRTADDNPIQGDVLPMVCEEGQVELRHLCRFAARFQHASYGVVLAVVARKGGRLGFCVNLDTQAILAWNLIGDQMLSSLISSSAVSRWVRHLWMAFPLPSGGRSLICCLVRLHRSPAAAGV